MAAVLQGCWHPLVPQTQLILFVHSRGSLQINRHIRVLYLSSQQTRKDLLSGTMQVVNISSLKRQKSSKDRSKA